MEYKRTQFIINRKFQFKFAFFVCSWIFALSMVYPIVIYNIFEYFIKISTEVSSVPALSPERVRDLQNQVLVSLGVLQLVFLGVTFILTLFLGHRIAGPLFKLRRAMDEVTKGNIDQKIIFRKNDHFIELQDSFNDMIHSLSIRRNK